MKELLLWLWQLPQHLLGLLLIVILRAHHSASCVPGIDIYIFKNKRLNGVSLGQYRLLSENRADKNTVKHEYGHSRQSLYCGWLYLFIVGVPSLFNNLLARITSCCDWYYSRWPEKDADNLGKVDRYKENI